MSSSSPVHQPQIHESEDSISINPNQSDPETLVPPQQPLLDPEDNSPEDDDDEEEEGEEADEGQDHQENPANSSGMSPINDSKVSVPDVTLAALPSTRRGGIKRKKGKGKGKGKGKPNAKKQQAIDEKVKGLMANLNPIPFIPSKLLHFAKHEALLRRLGLWDFGHIDLDRNVRVDLIAQLIASYEPKSRASYVNGYRIRVNRADLARAIKLPGKKEKGSGGGVDVDLDGEPFTAESIAFILDFVSDWVLLHEDTWMTPNEVMEWLKLIKDGHPEKVDWAGMFWFMVEKELKQGAKLRDCYYASHLQQLIKSQRETLFLKSEPIAETVELDAEAKENEEKEEKGEEANVEDSAVGGLVVDSVEEENCVMEGPSTELTLGQDGEKEEEKKDVDMSMDVDDCKVSDEEGEEGDEQGQWLLDGKNDLGDHFMQPCDAENSEDFRGIEVREEEDGEEEEEEDEEEVREEMDGEEDDEEAGNGFHVFPNDHTLVRDGFTGNLLESMEVNHMPFHAEGEHIHSPSSAGIRTDMQHIGSTHSFLNSTGKRVLEHDDDDEDVDHISHRLLNERNKKVRIGDSWENKPADFGLCLDQIQHLVERARTIGEEKERALEESNMNHQLLLVEIENRTNIINQLHKTRLEEAQKKDREIYRLERELYLMETVVEGYRSALKETQKAFAEYREKAQLPEEPTYRDAGDGGLMLTAPEIEKLEKKQEEEYKMHCLFYEKKVGEFEEELLYQFKEYHNKVQNLDKKLTSLEVTAGSLIQLNASRKISQTDEKMADAVVKTLQISQIEEQEAEVGTLQPTPQTEEEPSPRSEEEPILQPEEKVLEVAEPTSIPQEDEKMAEAEVEEPLPKE